jgi:hypothetical protein
VRSILTQTQNYEPRPGRIPHNNSQCRLRTNGSSLPPYKPTLEEIQERAYEIYIQRGRIDGFDLADWRQAEKELNEISHERTDSRSCSTRTDATPTGISVRMRFQGGTM